MTRFHRSLPRASALAVAALLLVALVPTALGQGAFYVEEEKDGRIYVFNDMKVYEKWKASGELGPTISRPGEGPKGETLIFDGVEAFHLYNFRHGRQGEVLNRPEEKKPATKVSWKDGKTIIETDDALLNISNRVQVRFTHLDPENGDGRSSFRLRRVRTKLDGWIYRRNFQYELQVDFADTSNQLQDANFNYAWKPALQIKGGQFKVPFGRQELTSSGSQQFVDRSIVSNEFARGRDIGVQLWGNTLGEKLEWRAGAFNGNGRTVSANDNDAFQYNARLTYQPWGDVKYSEGDFETTDRPRFAIAANLENNDRQGASAGNDVSRRVLGADAVFKYRGLSLFAESFTRDNEPETGVATTSEGWHAQVGYFVVRNRFEVAGRYASWDPSDAGGNDERTETGIAFNWFLRKHNLKLQSDLRQIEDDAADTTNREIRVQLQFVF